MFFSFVKKSGLGTGEFLHHSGGDEGDQEKA